jgi:hypothetical protein
LLKGKIMSNSISTGVAYKDPEFSDVVITGTLTVGGSVFNAQELAALDGVTAGTVTANKAMIVDGSKNIGTVGNFAATAVDTDLLTVTTSSASTSGSVSVEPVVVSTTMTGAGGVGGRAKFLTTINAALGSWSNAVKGEVVYGASGSTTGLGSAVLAEMTLSAGTSAGTYAPIEIELNVPSGAATGTLTSFIYASMQGDGVATMDTNGRFINLAGVTAGAGKMWKTGSTLGTAAGGLRCRIAGTDYWLPFYAAEPT